jgi:uncharacterized protein YbbK (DUF523 family)
MDEKPARMMFVVSACLAGERCRYDGSAKTCRKVVDLTRKGEAIPVCPEVLAGLPVPREPAELVDGRVITGSGRDATADYMRGAERGLKVALAAHCTKAILKSRSPSCGTNPDGVFAALLRKAGLKLRSEEQI